MDKRILVLIVCLIIIICSVLTSTQGRNFVEYSPDMNPGAFCEAEVIALCPVFVETSTSSRGSFVGTSTTESYYCLALLEDGTIGVVNTVSNYSSKYSYYEIFIENWFDVSTYDVYNYLDGNWGEVSNKAVVVQGKAAEMPYLGWDVERKFPELCEKLKEITVLDATALEAKDNRVPLFRYIALFIGGLEIITYVPDFKSFINKRRKTQVKKE